MPSFRDIHGFWINPPTAASPSGVWDWSIDQNQRAIMRMAQERGADVFELFSNSPMWWMNSNNSSDGNEGGDCLKPDQENSFAKYLATVVRHARDDWSIHFQSAEAFNEPAAGWWKYPGTQEGCNFSRDTQARMIAKLRSELDSDGLKDVIVSASDENDADAAVSTWNDFDQATRARIGRVNVHGYFAGTNPYRGGNMTVLRDEIANSKPIWMSEYGDNDASGATMAQSIIFDIRGLHPSAWVYWQPVEPHRSGWGLINADYQDSSPEPAPASTPLAQINRKFFVFGQFTRYVRPGWQIIDIDDSNSIAAYDSAQHHLVIVTKTGPAPARMDLDLTRFKRIGGTYLIVTTSLRDTAQPDRKLAIEGPLKIDDARQKKFSPELYPNAVETFVMDAVY
jgi:galactan endo-1,6-beta-galactosidase